MDMKRFINFLPLILFFLPICMFAQLGLSKELGDSLEGKKNLNDIIHSVNSFYSNEKSKLSTDDSFQRKFINRQMKFWNRWVIFNRARLDSNNEITDVNKRNWNAFRQMERTGIARTNEQQLSYGFWVPIGPTSFTRLSGGHGGGLGRVNRIAFHPSDGNILYIACPSGGLWKSNNGGATWFPLADHIPTTGISGIVISHADPNTIYILTGDGDVNIFPNDVGVWRASLGVFKSTDGGINWFSTGTFPNTNGDYWGYKLIQDPTNANILFAATSDGIYKTMNGGTNWTQVQTGKFTDIEFNPGNHNILYAARMADSNPLSINDAFYRSTNNGDSFSNTGITGIPLGILRLAIAVTPNDPDDVYVLAAPSTSPGQFKGIHYSVNSGVDFHQKMIAPNILGWETDGSDWGDQGWYDLSLAVNPSNNANVIVGGINIWSSSDFGATFFNRTQWDQANTPGNKYVHADVHDLAYNYLNNRLYSCTDGGVSVSYDHGLTWSNAWNSLQIMEFYHLNGYEPDFTKLIGGTQDNGTNYRKSNSNNYFHIEGADGYCAVIDYADTNILYLTGNQALEKSIDAGATQPSDITPPADPNDKSWPMVAINTIDHNTIYAGKRSSIFKSTTGGGGWVDKGASGNMALVTCPSNSSRIYACSGPDVNIKVDAITQTWRSDNGGDNWIDLNSKPGFPNPASNPHATDLAVCPTNSFLVWVTTGGYTAGRKVYFSNDAGETWTNISGSLPNVPTTAIVSDNAGNVYAGTDLGVFYRAFNAVDWVPFYNGLPKVPIADLVFNNTSGTIIAATFGRGVFQSGGYTACTPTLTIGTTFIGNRYYEASSWISTTSSAEGVVGTEIFLKAGDSVMMKNGFEIKAGTFFKAFIGPCASGIPTHSRIYQDYNITNANQIVKQELLLVDETPSGENDAFEIKRLTEDDKEITLSISKDQFVQIYLEDDEHEILCWLVRSNLPPGNYKMTFNDKKILNGKVQLKINLDGKSKNILLPKSTDS